ncbi:maleylpyruvate isomerase family mycothiol-dependent enzyme [Modestobacter sp. Leaf380]|uniref:maleylpyruvate isomerase family mycothiol-dependent enzyme n=1 Tax=Modestobacter sp. Leaf380 TaxID=1736356 RepID=UPI0007009940|nr:maleylpyruvate isomerase family mycothiol-dependent enzyme [Modestobacter sp. Leaf380]KQS69245.1 hypothetical protein ASG41_21740 [Modestobacter sp. Leaf380]
MTLPDTLDSWAEGEQLLATALGRLTDPEFADPSLLPGWSRHQLLAHVARNADALVNLLTWARTGDRTPMYASPEDRAAGIESATALSPAALRAEVLGSVVRFVTAVQELPADAWEHEVATFSGRTVPASEVVWMRCREVYVHAVDLAAGVGFEDLPDDVLAALLDDVLAMWAHRGEQPDLTLRAGEASWGSGSTVVTGSLPALVAWVTGRSDGAGLTGGLPRVPAWL